MWLGGGGGGVGRQRIEAGRELGGVVSTLVGRWTGMVGLGRGVRREGSGLVQVSLTGRVKREREGGVSLAPAGGGRGSLDVLVCRPCLLNIRVSLESGETWVETDPGSGTGGQDCNCGPGGVPGAGGGDGKKRLKEGPSSV